MTSPPGLVHCYIDCFIITIISDLMSIVMVQNNSFYFSYIPVDKKIYQNFAVNIIASTICIKGINHLTLGEGELYFSPVHHWYFFFRHEMSIFFFFFKYYQNFLLKSAQFTLITFKKKKKYFFILSLPNLNLKISGR